MSNHIVGSVYQQVIEDVINASRVDFEEGGVDESVLEELKKGWQQKLSQLEVATFPWDPKLDTPPAPAAAPPAPQAAQDHLPQMQAGAPYPQATASPQPVSHSLPLPTGGGAGNGPQIKQEPSIKQEPGAGPSPLNMVPQGDIAQMRAMQHIADRFGDKGAAINPQAGAGQRSAGHPALPQMQSQARPQQQQQQVQQQPQHQYQPQQQQPPQQQQYQPQPQQQQYQPQPQQQQQYQLPQQQQQQQPQYQQQQQQPQQQPQQQQQPAQQQPQTASPALPGVNNAQTDGPGDRDDDYDDIQGVLMQRDAAGTMHELGRVDIDRLMHRQILSNAKAMEGGGLMLPLKEATRHRTAASKRKRDGAGASGVARYDGDDDDDDEVADEDAINSDLDDTDDEREDEEVDDEGLGHIMLCMYDKVQRVKNKWKCVLKDGVLTVNGKEYIFHKATGEYEW
ncbi:hypothetical protein ACRALDRAFT_1062416 [Sodiomyces alcalophilus JCM 7366]|uniref:uncharacterized protein n=1 Tax=Sodiomyces alcalophilus JCM 7366 TaxID=591952 RepID=UPI0039B50192